MGDKKIVFSRQEIAEKIKDLGRQITMDYRGNRLVVVGVLNGAFMFVADLVREIHLPLEIDFVRVASYGRESTSSGEIKFTKDVELSLAGKDVLLVEDIVDTGRTMAFLHKFLADRFASSVRICALIDKRERRDKDVEIDYVGFAVEKGFLIGYGLDFAEQHRNYADIYHLVDPDGRNKPQRSES